MAGSGMWKMRNAENAGCGVERREEKRKDAYKMAVVSGYFQVLSLNMALNREWIWRGEAATGDGVIINFTTEGLARHSRNQRNGIKPTIQLPQKTLYEVWRVA
jgi:hypothetical protein